MQKNVLGEPIQPFFKSKKDQLLPMVKCSAPYKKEVVKFMTHHNITYSEMLRYAFNNSCGIRAE